MDFLKSGHSELFEEFIMEGYGTSVDEFISSLEGSKKIIAKVTLDQIGYSSFINNAVLSSKVEKFLDRGFDGMELWVDRRNLYKKNAFRSNILDWVEVESSAIGLSSEDWLCGIHKYFPKNNLGNTTPDDISFPREDIYSVFCENNTKHKYYKLMTACLVQIVLESVFADFSAFIDVKVATHIFLEAAKSREE